MFRGSLKDGLSALKLKLEDLEKVLDTTEKPKTETKIEVKEYHNTEDKLNDLLQKDKVIKLNIGGKIFLTKIATVIASENSLFAKVLKEEGDGAKELFFDRSFNNFEVILEFMRDKKINLKKLNKFEREDLIEEINYYGLTENLNLSKKIDFDLKWSQSESKQGACTVNSTDPTQLTVHSTGCYTHFMTDKIWKDEENFCVEFESDVQQTDNYLYYGIVNENYNLTSSCMCCSPMNAFYVQCNGNFKMNSASSLNNSFAFCSEKTVIGIKVNLKEKTIQFYIPDNTESEVFSISGNQFRIVSGHCNTGNGKISILTCSEI